MRRSRSYVGMLGSGDSCSRTSRDKPYDNPNPNRETPAGVHTLIEASNTHSIASNHNPLLMTASYKLKANYLDP